MLRHWKDKFARAFRGLGEGLRRGSSFAVHGLTAGAVIAAAAALKMDALPWCLLLLCIAGVFAAELFNTALEAMAKAITRETSPHIRDALDIAAGAVLVAAIGSVAVGLILFGRVAGNRFGWW